MQMNRWLWAIIAVGSIVTASAGTFVAEYDINAYDEGWGHLSIPARNGEQLSAIQGIVISYPGLGQSTDYPANDRWAKWLYEHGLAYLGGGGVYSLEPYSTNTFGGIAYPELDHVPILAFGESAGGSGAYYTAMDHPERTIAFAVEHTRFFSDVHEYDPIAKTVPGYFRWGEWDNERFNQGYYSYEEHSILPMIQSGAQWMTLVESRQTHASRMYALEEAMGFFSLVLPLRYEYEAGVAGKDPKLGPVTLTTIAWTNGYFGEHNLGHVQTDDGNYANFMKDWESRDPYFASHDEFERHDKTNHSWIASASLGAFWASKFSHGQFDLLVDFMDIMDDDLGQDVVVKRNSVFPNYFLTGQDIRVEVDPVDFPNTDRVEFYANEHLVGTVHSPPYLHAYNFAPGEEGMYAIYPVAVASDGQRCVGPRRMVQVYANERGTNTAPTITPIGNITGNPGQTLSVPFTVDDAESDPSSLTATWRYVNRTSSIGAGSYAISVTGSGSERFLEITLPPEPGIIWGFVQVSDGHMSANAYVSIHVTGDGSAAPFFVGNEFVTFVGPNQTHNAWSRRISCRIYDYDTDPRDLTLTATSSNTNNIPNHHIHIGGSGQFRYVQVKPVNGAATITFTLSDGNTNVTRTYYCNPVTQSNVPPVISAIPDQTAWYANESDPVEVRVYDLHTPNEAILPSDTPLVLHVTSSDQTLIPNANIQVTDVGPRRRITFTPAYNQTGTATLTATVTDEGGLTAVETFEVVVTAPPPLAAASGTLPNATITQVYDASCSASGGIQPYTWSLHAGGLPDGLSLNSDGTITGTPSEVGTFDFTAEVTDSDPGGAATDTAVYEITVHPDVTAPSDLVATAETNTTITLTWTDTAVGEAGYEIQRRPQGDVTWNHLLVTPPNAESHLDDDGLIAGETYEYRLRAVGSVTGLFTAVVSAQAVAVPEIVTQPQPVSVLPGNSATLTVVGSGGALSYTWYEGLSGDTSSPVPDGDGASVLIPNVLETRTFWVRVQNPAGEVDSDHATVSVNAASALSLLFNFGSSESGNWNNLVRGGNVTTETTVHETLIYDDGQTAEDVSLELVLANYSATSHQDYDNNYATETDGDPDAVEWLTDSAANSAFRINQDESSIRMRLSGLIAGTYVVEVYVAASRDGWAHGNHSIVAGVVGATATTTNQFNTASFSAAAAGQNEQVAVWEEVEVASEEVLEVLVAEGSKWVLLNAVRVTRLGEGEEPSGYDLWADTYGLTGTNAEKLATPYDDNAPNLLKYALGLPGNQAAGPGDMPYGLLNELNETFDYVFRRERADLDYTVERTESLVPADWQTEVVNPGEVGGEVTVPIDVNGYDRLYLRLKVSDE